MHGKVLLNKFPMNSYTLEFCSWIQKLENGVERLIRTVFERFKPRSLSLFVWFECSGESSQEKSQTYMYKKRILCKTRIIIVVMRKSGILEKRK